MTATSLYAKHARLARDVSYGYFVVGLDRDDVHQEARLALWKAASTFDPAKGNFPSFARMCIKAHLAQLIQWSQRDRQVANAGAGELPDHLPHLHQVVDLVEEREEVARVLRAVAGLPEFQRHCVVGIATGLSYAEIGPNYRRIDNALYQARKTLRAAA